MDTTTEIEIEHLEGIIFDRIANRPLTPEQLVTIKDIIEVFNEGVVKKGR